MSNFVYNTEEITNNQLQTKQPTFSPFELKDAVNPTTCFEFDNTVNPSELASRLIETAKKFKSYSCCSNQVGLESSVFVAGYDQEFVAFFNPVIIDHSKETTLSKESDNISFPGLVLNIERSNSITVKYQDYEGKEHIQKFDGLTARIIQQCVHRLDGITFDKLVSRLQLQRANKAVSKKIKKIVNQQMNRLRLKK